MLETFTFWNVGDVKMTFGPDDNEAIEEIQDV